MTSSAMQPPPRKKTAAELLEDIRARCERPLTVEEKIAKLEAAAKDSREHMQKVMKRVELLQKLAAEFYILLCVADENEEVAKLFSNARVMAKLMTEDYDDILAKAQDVDNFYLFTDLLDHNRDQL